LRAGACGERIAMNKKAIYGVVTFVVVFALFGSGIFVLLAGFGFIGHGIASEGNIEIVYNQLGKITGLSGQLFVVLMGVTMVIVTTCYCMQATDRALHENKQKRDEGRSPDNLLWATIKHFNPCPGIPD
jgi:hypothetical protein